MAIQHKSSSKKPSTSNPTKAPAQHSQPSRKGKKAWRKHVDIGEIESGMEGIREEERMTGSAFHAKSNNELFHIDTKGDDKVRQNLPKVDFSQLSYRKYLEQRSAVSAIPSRSTPQKRSTVSREDKERLLATAKRKRKGPLNSIIDPTEVGKGSASFDPSHAAKNSGTYDVWANDGSKNDECDEFLPVHQRKLTVKPPTHKHPKVDIALPAIPQPHPGTSYKPSTEARAELLHKAQEKAAQEHAEAEERTKLRQAREAAWALAREAQQDGVPSGMTIDDGEEDEPLADSVDDERPAQKPTVRKTKQQRRKAEQQKIEKRLLLERAAKKRYLASLAAARSITKTMKKEMSAKEQARVLRKAALAEKLKNNGLAGQRIGKHFVPEEKPDAQLSEDMSESLRGMKMEGNLFKDRFLSLQRRALIEPRARVILKKRRNTKEVTKHAWKRFQ